MVGTADSFTAWLAEARVPEQHLTASQRSLLYAAFCFRQKQGTDYYATRLLGHFLLHCDSGLPVAQIARLLHVSRPTASRQQGLAAKQVIQQAHHRMDGRPYGKLLPRYAGPIAEFLCTHPKATRLDLLDFIGQTWNIRVRRTALFHFLKRFGLDHVPALTPAPEVPLAPVTPPPAPTASTKGTATARPTPTLPATPIAAPRPQPVVRPAPPFCSATPSTAGPSSSCPRR
jgi:hypothetical protein